MVESGYCQALYVEPVRPCRSEPGLRQRMDKITVRSNSGDYRADPLCQNLMVVARVGQVR